MSAVDSLVLEEESVLVRRRIRNFLTSLPVMMLAHHKLVEQHASVVAAIPESLTAGIYIP